MAGAGKAHSQARGGSIAGLRDTAGPDQGSICSLAAVVIYAVLLRKRDCAAEVDELVVERFKGYRAHSGTPTDDASGRRLIRAWNSNVGHIQGWPARRLAEPAVKPFTEVPWTEFPEGLRRDVDQYLQGLTKVRKGRSGRRIRPLKPTTIRQRRMELAAGADERCDLAVDIPNVEAYITDLTARVRSVTAYNCIHMLRRAAKFIGADCRLF